MNSLRIVVSGSDEQTIRQGTGWIVLPGVLCTAFHVVGLRESGRWLHEDLAGTRYQIGASVLAPLAFDGNADLAFLAYASDAAPMLLATDCKEKEVWDADVYPAPSERPVACSGTVLRAHASESLAQLLIDQGTNISWEGASGGAIRNAQQHVIAVLNSASDHMNTVWATPIDAVHRLVGLYELIRAIEAQLDNRATSALERQSWLGLDSEGLKRKLDLRADQDERSPQWALARQKLAFLSKRAPMTNTERLALLSAASRIHLNSIKEAYTSVIDTNTYVSRALETELREFLSSEANGKTTMVIVGQSGMGKSTLISSFLRTMVEEGNLGFFIKSCGVPENASDPRCLREFLMSRLSALTNDLVASGPSGIIELNQRCHDAGKHLILAIDAVNEFNAESGTFAALLAFMVSIDDLADYLRKHQLFSIKVIVTSRPETWRLGSENERLQAYNTGNAYFAAKEHLYHELGRFSEEEAEDAYAKFTGATFDQRGRAYTQLSDLTRCQLRDPFLLTVACEVYPEGLPDDLDCNALYQKYRALKVGKSMSDAGIAVALDTMTNAMFEGRVIVRDSVPLNVVVGADRGLERKLLDSNIVRAVVGAHAVHNLRFAYDRFAHFLLAETLLEKIRAAAVPYNSSTLADAALDIIIANLPGAQHLATVFGALRRVLIELGDELAPIRAEPTSMALAQKTDSAHAGLLCRLATTNERGLALAVSVLARLATLDTPERQGLEPVRVLFKHFADSTDQRSRSVARHNRLGFPIVDAVYRILLDDEYRSWRKGQTEVVRRAHTEVLYTYFNWGIQHRRSDTSSSSAQYLFFLWQIEHAQDDATEILSRNVTRARWSNLRRVGARRAMLNSAWTICFVLARHHDSRATRALEAGKRLIGQLGLDRPVLGRMMTAASGFLVERAFRREFQLLSYPVNPMAMQALFASSELRQQGKQALTLLRVNGPWSEADWSLAERLSLSQNGIILQFTCFAASTAHEMLATQAERTVHVERLAGLFPPTNEMGGAHYMVALAFYHINFFGAHGSAGALEAMGTMAGVLLRDGKGMFNLGDRQFSTNIIGTYGRALGKHASLLHAPHNISFEPPLAYAIRALTEAKDKLDMEYYRFVCADIGLLGVLIEPQQVFEVFSHILQDLGMGRDGIAVDPRLKFSELQRGELRRQTIMSLANIRAIYRAEVDRFLLDEFNDLALYSEVSEALPEFNLTTIGSWTSEQLIFVLMTRYRRQFGERLLDCFDCGLAQPDAVGATKSFVHQIFHHVRAMELATQ